MIASLSGKIIHTGEKYCVLETGGVGYKVFVSPETLSGLEKNSDSVFLFIHTVVREDAFELYGFKDVTSQDMFEKLISISGIGPRGALGILSVASTQELQNAIANGDLGYLTKVSGIGKKTAEKILLELRDKMSLYSTDSANTNTVESDVVLALESLGYSTQDAREAVRLISPETVGVSNKVKEALKALAK
jgi:Holliday junction DNA helicase RuvA